MASYQLSLENDLFFNKFFHKEFSKENISTNIKICMCQVTDN